MVEEEVLCHGHGQVGGAVGPRLEATSDAVERQCDDAVRDGRISGGRAAHGYVAQLGLCGHGRGSGCRRGHDEVGGETTCGKISLEGEPLPVRDGGLVAVVRPQRRVLC